jgi:crotonobetainyl-CoA:carnitine CoA-transferase CaiB-like acyl-CoA transferase
LNSDLPLSGIRVLDFSRALAGPFCTMMLADMGADVVKVEPPGRGDESRAWGPPFINGESAYFMSINRGKKSIVLDLTRSDSREVVRRLIQRSDVIVENFRPGTAKKLGIDYESAKLINQKVVYCSISGFGQTGPYRELPGYDIIAFAMSGMMSITGEEGRPPVKVGVPVADIGAGMYAAFAIVSTLFKRSRSDSGDFIDVSLLEGQISWLTYQAGAYFATLQNPPRLGSAHMTIAPYQAFKAADSYFIVAAGNDELWRRLCDVIGAPGLKDEPEFSTNPDRVRNRAKLEERLNQIFGKKRAAEWVRLISEAGVPSCMINQLSDVFSDPHVKERSVVTEVKHPRAGVVKMISPPYRFASQPPHKPVPPPMLGQHTEEILRELEFSDKEVASIMANKL